MENISIPVPDPSPGDLYLPFRDMTPGDMRRTVAPLPFCDYNGAKGVCPDSGTRITCRTNTRPRRASCEETRVLILGSWRGRFVPRRKSTTVRGMLEVILRSSVDNVGVVAAPNAAGAPVQGDWAAGDLFIFRERTASERNAD